MYFKLSTKPLAKPGRVTFRPSERRPHRHDFKIAGKVTPDDHIRAVRNLT